MPHTKWVSAFSGSCADSQQYQRPVSPTEPCLARPRTAHFLRLNRILREPQRSRGPSVKTSQHDSLLQRFSQDAWKPRTIFSSFSSKKKKSKRRWQSHSQPRCDSGLELWLQLAMKVTTFLWVHPAQGTDINHLQGPCTFLPTKGGGVTQG